MNITVPRPPTREQVAGARAGHCHLAGSAEQHHGSWAPTMLFALDHHRKQPGKTFDLTASLMRRSHSSSLFTTSHTCDSFRIRCLLVTINTLRGKDEVWNFSSTASWSDTSMR